MKNNLNIGAMAHIAKKHLNKKHKEFGCILPENLAIPKNKESKKEPTRRYKTIYMEHINGQKFKITNGLENFLLSQNLDTSIANFFFRTENIGKVYYEFKRIKEDMYNE